MWIVGTLILYVIGVAAVVVIGWIPRDKLSPPMWDITGTGQVYTGIVGTLGGFSVASAIFIAGLDIGRTSPAFATVIGMLLIAFLILIFSALIYASTPNAPDAIAAAATPTLSHALANMSGCLGLTTAWLGLVPLLELLDLPALASEFTWVLLFVALSAGWWVGLFDFYLTRASAAACLAIPVVGFALPAIYRLLAARFWPALWPASDAALRYAFVALGVSGLVFTLHLGLLLAHGRQETERRLQRDGHRAVLAASAAYGLAVGFIWLAVAVP